MLSNDFIKRQIIAHKSRLFSWEQDAEKVKDGYSLGYCRAKIHEITETINTLELIDELMSENND